MATIEDTRASRKVKPLGLSKKRLASEPLPRAVQSACSTLDAAAVRGGGRRARSVCCQRLETRSDRLRPGVRGTHSWSGTLSRPVALSWLTRHGCCGAHHVQEVHTVLRQCVKANYQGQCGRPARHLGECTLRQLPARAVSTGERPACSRPRICCVCLTS